MLQTIITPLCITLVVCGIMFFYFRNRLSLTETKVNLMFELIQEHENQRKIMSHSFHPMMHPEVLHSAQEHSEQLQNKENTTGQPLIDVSDDEMSDSDESDTDMSDGDDDERLTMGQTLADDEGIKSVTLTLEGAETGAKAAALNDLDAPQEVHTEPLDKTDIKEINIKGEEKQSDDIDDINLSGAESLDQDSDDEEDEEDEDDNTDDDMTPESNVKTVVHKLPEDKPFDKWRVKELKQECANRGLDNYKKMKKTALVDLLNKTTANNPAGVN